MISADRTLYWTSVNVQLHTADAKLSNHWPASTKTNKCFSRSFWSFCATTFWWFCVINSFGHSRFWSRSASDSVSTTFQVFLILKHVFFRFYVNDILNLFRILKRVLLDSVSTASQAFSRFWGMSFSDSDPTRFQAFSSFCMITSRWAFFCRLFPLTSCIHWQQVEKMWCRIVTQMPEKPLWVT